MNIIYLHPNNYINPHLFPTYKKTFEEQGHTEVSNPYDATHCFMEVVSGEVKYNQEILRVVRGRNIPIICFDNREFHVMGTGKWKPIDLPIDIYFVRTIIDGDEYPSNVYPYDWAYFNGCDFNPVSKEELFYRDYDACFIGVEAPARRSVINGLLKDGKPKVKFIFNDHLTRSPNDRWINEYRDAKFYIECEGGGLTSEKFLQLFSVSAMLKVRNEQRMAFPFTDMVNCVEISKYPTEEDIIKLMEVINDKDVLYGIYINGINYIKKYYSPESISNYVLKIIDSK